ncbi:LytR/AlgR family response regulator transcription factor [Paenibacillus sp. IHBB 3054]|uniref:LytR/AlgR family response regulator transcription factor n=1 Tax=Paenibacillus sp. IHBB 3054 TaxID=3425689 RepID=UPI003F680966
MNLHIAICDDQRTEASRLEELLMKLLMNLQGITGTIEIFESGQSLLTAMSSTAYDIVYLDIEMPGYNGIEVAEKIRLEDAGVLIIYVTSHTSYMRRSFEVHPFRYLLKPIDEHELQAATVKAVQQCMQRSNVLSFSIHHMDYNLKVDDIMYITVERGKKLVLCTENATYSYYGKLGELEGRLWPHDFCRVHTGYLVNWLYVRSLSKELIQLKNGVELPVSRSRSSDSLRSYHAFIEKRLLR